MAVNSIASIASTTTSYTSACCVELVCLLSYGFVYFLRLSQALTGDWVEERCRTESNIRRMKQGS